MTTTAQAPAARLPRQVPYIIGNEACERFSFYGMRNILVQFYTQTKTVTSRWFDDDSVNDGVNTTINLR